MNNATHSLREQIEKEIGQAREKNGQKWYLWFDNFSLSTAGFPMRGQSSETLDRHLRDEIPSSDLRRSKTYRQFYADIDDAFRKAGQFDVMIERSDLLSRAHNSKDAKNIHEVESLLAETFIEPYILLREMGYSTYDLR